MRVTGPFGVPVPESYPSACSVSTSRLIATGTGGISRIRLSDKVCMTHTRFLHEAAVSACESCAGSIKPSVAVQSIYLEQRDSPTLRAAFLRPSIDGPPTGREASRPDTRHQSNRSRK